MCTTTVKKEAVGIKWLITNILRSKRDAWYYLNEHCIKKWSLARGASVNSNYYTKNNLDVIPSLT